MTKAIILDLLTKPAQRVSVFAENKRVTKSDEITRLALQTAEHHSTNTMLLACTTNMTMNLITHYAHVNDADLRAVQGVLHEALALWRESRGITEGQINDALAGLVRAGQVAAVLASLPD